MRLVAIMLMSMFFTSFAMAAEPLPDLSIASGKTITLRLGESRFAGDGGLQVGFEEVRNDSRCPKGEQCVWAGDATVRVWLQNADGPRVARELHTAPRPSMSNDADPKGQGVALRVLRLDPAPVTGRTIARQDYALTLSIGPNGSTDPDR